MNESWTLFLNKFQTLLMHLLLQKTFTILEKHQPKLTLTCTGIWYSNLDGVDHEELDEIAAVDDDILENKNEVDHLWEEEINFRSYDNGEVNVIRDNNPIDYTYDEANLTTKETRKESVEIVTDIDIKTESVGNVSDVTENIEEIIKNENEIQNKEKTVKNLSNLEITNDVKNDNIETTEETVENPYNEILDNLPEDYTDDDESCVSNESDEISCKSVKNISSEPIDERSKLNKKFGLNKTLQTVTILSKKEHIAEMKKDEENRHIDIDTLNRHMEVHSKVSIMQYFKKYTFQKIYKIL